jgi:hypothetical protein
MMFRPAGRFLIGPLPPADFAARFFAAVILPPLVFLAMGFVLSVEKRRSVSGVDYCVPDRFPIR